MDRRVESDWSGVRERRAALLSLLTMVLALPAWGAALQGVTMPDAQEVAGTRLELNGTALRTFSFLKLRVYVAGLYLAHRSSDADEILASPGPELLRFVFLRDVPQGAARRSWRTSLNNACPAPCAVPAALIETFLQNVPAIRSGDVSTLRFADGTVDISVNGKMLGHVGDAAFSHVILATFIGEHPTAPEVKRGLLGGAG